MSSLVINNYATPYRDDLFKQILQSAPLGAAEFLYASTPEKKRQAIGWNGQAHSAAPGIRYANDPSLRLSKAGHRLCVPLRTIGALVRSRASVVVCSLSRDMALVQLVCWTIARLRSKRLVYWVGDVPEAGRPGLAHRAIDRLRLFLARRADGFIFYSPLSRTWAQDNGIALDTTTRWTGGQVRRVNAQSTPRREGHPILRVLFVGGSDARKGLDGLIADCNRIADRFGRRLQILVAGDPERYRKRVGDVRVISVGRISAAEMHRAYACCDVTAIASLREPWGFVFNESILAGRPCIVSEHAGSAVLAKRYGLNYRPGNAGSLAAALEKADEIADADLCAIAETLSVERAAESFMNFLDAAADGRPLGISDY